MNKLKTIDLKLVSLSLTKQVRQYRIDIIIVIGLAIAIAISTALGANQIPNPIFTDLYAQDVWFGSDIPTVFGNITSFDSDFGRNNKHPLFPLIVFPLVFGARVIFGIDSLAAIKLLVVAVAALWVILLYILFRVMGCQRLDATLFSILGGVSAASMFWLVTPESFPLGSVTILLGLIFVVLTQAHQFPLIWYVALNVSTVSITITNVMVGIFATLVNQRWWQIIKIGIFSLFVATSLWIVQRILFTNTGFPFQPGTFIGEKKFVSAPEHNGVLAAMSSFFYQTIVMPATEVIDSPFRSDWVKLDSYTLNPASGGWFGGIAIFAWTILLLLGLWALFSIAQHAKLRIVLGLTLIAQVLMHSVYGVQETFIYTLHFVPLLLTLVALSLFTRFRPLSLILVATLIISAGVTNRTQFNSITSTLWNYGTPHQQLAAQMKLRPFDPWLRSTGHVILASPGSGLENKAFHEPGGSFSPKPGSFGVSIWVVDRQGNLKTTSDRLPLGEIQQQLIDSENTDVPGIATQTAYYQSSWTATKPGNWRLNLNRVPTTNTKTAVVVRSVGPAGGAIKSLDWNGQRLLINDRWIVKNLPNQVQVYLGSEKSPHWTREKSIQRRWQDDRGWGYAHFEAIDAEGWEIEVEDLTPTTFPELAATNVAEPVLNLPDTQFIDSFNAQIAHLMMGLVGNQTRPGDPIDYPLPRFRDGVYEVAALARTGHLEVAKQLIPYFATTDFTNGTQLAADIPALGIWALTTVAEQVNQQNYDRSLWPDVYRKAELILNLLASNRPGYPVTKTSEIPFSEQPDLVRIDTISGKMDATPGLIAIDPTANFMSYRALLDAATFAERIKQPEIAKRWRSQAVQLQAAWKKQFDLRTTTENTYTNGLWPSWLASSSQESFKQGLESQWQATHEGEDMLKALPGNPNSILAQAHQWLYLNQPKRVWSTMQTLWQHQASPGLYTWSADREANIPDSLSQWHRYRGWMNVSQITPHYWTAAELLLLQLDMLAYLNPTENPTLVIGAGIPQEWLNQPLKVKGLLVGGNVVNWMWDGKQMNVEIRGQATNKVELGGAFPANTPLNIVSVSSPA